MTFKSLIFDRLVRITSVIPSLKYSSSVSALKDVNGSTATDLGPSLASAGREVNNRELPAQTSMTPNMPAATHFGHPGPKDGD